MVGAKFQQEKGCEDIHHAEVLVYCVLDEMMVAQHSATFACTLQFYYYRSNQIRLPTHLALTTANE